MLGKSILAIMVTFSSFAQEPTNKTKSVPATTPISSTVASRALLDHDLLDPAYFGIDGALMKETKIADFMWVKPEFTFKGHTLKVEWEKPNLLVPHDEKLDLEVADRLSEILPQEFSKSMATSLWPSTKVSSVGADLILTGRIVMINVRSRFSLSKNILTFDLKIMNAATKEVILACHHRVIPYGGRGSSEKDLAYRVATYASEFSEYCLANYSK